MQARISRGGAVSTSFHDMPAVSTSLPVLAQTQTSGRRSSSSLSRTIQRNYASRGLHRHASAQRMGEAEAIAGDKAVSGGTEQSRLDEDQAVVAAKRLLQALSKYRPQSPTER